ncbi:MAG: hypothetical protein AAB973_00325 [Patescibacteria group bacterium]
MSLIEQDGQEVPPQPGASEKEKQIEQARRKHLEAMAVAIGANPLTSSLSIEALLGATQELAGIDYSKNILELDPEMVERIEAIGKWYLSGSPQADQLKFTVGARVLSLLKENPNSGYFTNLKSFVNMWTDGDGGSKFDEILAGRGENGFGLVQ